MNHTNGEWKPQGNYNGAVGIWQGSEPICFLPEYQRESICLSINDVKTREANSRLLASAPELYEALKALVNKTRGTKYFGSDEITDAIVALAKAEGKE